MENQLAQYLILPLCDIILSYAKPPKAHIKSMKMIRRARNYCLQYENQFNIVDRNLKVHLLMLSWILKKQWSKEKLLMLICTYDAMEIFMSMK